MSWLKYVAVGIHVNSDLVNVAIIGQDDAESTVNMGYMLSRKTVSTGCARVVYTLMRFVLLVSLSKADIMLRRAYDSVS